MTIISCDNASWVVMHYYERGNFPSLSRVDVALQKLRIPIGTSGSERVEKGENRKLPIALQQAESE